MFQLAADGKLTMELAEGNIENIDKLWDSKIDSGKRLVVSIN